MANILKPVKKIAGVVMGWGPKATTVLAHQRLKICMACPYKTPKNHVCRKCRCFVEEKVK